MGVAPLPTPPGHGVASAPSVVNSPRCARRSCRVKHLVAGPLPVHRCGRCRLKGLDRWRLYTQLGERWQACTARGSWYAVCTTTHAAAVEQADD
jgi:hypothetical protein